ncbi:VWFA and cache domain-containing protein 1 [Amphibalanus amphitrite]|uniref:VWFA and cache domain-containing protein 1 n=1 Tax=Amphibalanus amphitrite TaxID=1232801 RepID=A0A6A4W689_AMPAM|nr:VWFA and cache domain-containing protein 1 [Amphibalanus amphitrite]
MLYIFKLSLKGTMMQCTCVNLLLVILPFYLAAADQPVSVPYEDDAGYDDLNDGNNKIHPDNYVVSFTKPENVSEASNGALDNFLVSLKEAKGPAADFLQGIDIRTGAKRLSSHFVNLAMVDMGVKNLQSVYDQLPAASPEPTAADIQEVKRLASHIQAKLHRYVGALWRTRGVIEEMFWKHLHDPMTTVTPCCSLDDRDLKYSLKFGSPVNLNATCDIAPSVLEPFAFNPGRNVTDAFIANLQSHPSIKWQYFISKDGIHSEYPAHKFASQHDCSGYDDTRHQQVYLSTVHPAAKHVVILIDVGGRPSGHQLAVARAAARRLLHALGHTDRVAVLAVSDRVQRPATRACFKHGLSSATGDAKHFLAGFIDGCRPASAPTNHTLGLEAAFELLTRVPSLRDRSGQALVVYISRGVLGSLFEPQQVMKVMAAYQRAINASVIVSAFGVASDWQSNLERDFLEHITRQDFSRYNISLQKRLTPGKLFVINSTDQLTFQVGKIFDVLNSSIASGKLPNFSLPYWDLVSKDLVVSVTQPCYHVDYFIGILGMDLHLPDLVEDITYFSQTGGRYAFIIDDHGYTLMHPSFARPLVKPRDAFHSDIGSVEHRPGFAAVRRRLLAASSGSEVLRYRLWDQRGFNVTVRVLYTWQRVQDFPYTVCIAYPDERRERPPAAPSSPPLDLVYHRIDLSRSHKVALCRQFRHVATMSSASLFLSATAFLSPYDHLTGFEPSYRVVQGYMAYLSDSTRLITNPGLKRAVRDDVAMTSRVTAHWRRRLMEAATTSRYTVRTFVATSRGVLVVYPGLPLDTWYEPTRRSWYLRALEHPGRVVLSSPYLDAGGAGYIVTLSQTISTAGGTVAAVMGMDMTIGYFYQLLVSVLGGRCQTPEVTCFLLDDRGYMISHPEHVSPWREGPVEQQHVSSKEPLLANHILSQQQFVSKKQCNSYTDNTVQRYYQFNTSMPDVVTNVGAVGDYCKQYQIVAVPGTNVFVGVVNQTCDNPAFCACSRDDRGCLNCERMEAWECECPCECRLRTDLCTEEVLDQHDTCGAVPETVYGPRVDRDVSHLADCVPVTCQTRQNASECVGVLGCEWCQLEADGRTPLSRPFCTDMERCFRGVLGAASPYGDRGPGVRAGGILPATSSPVGPVAGGIIGAFVSLALAVLCYRHRAAGRYRQAVPLALEEEEDEVAELELEPPPPAAVNRLALAPAAAVSPYRLNPGYRRPAAGTESDHGYSTMTPHDDSEAAGEPDPVRAASPASSMLSSPPPSAPVPLPDQTALRPHQIRAEALVHAVDAV